MSTSELKARLKDLPADEVRRLKRLRRTVKNRAYAAGHRRRDLRLREGLQHEIDMLRDQVAELRRENASLRLQMIELLRRRFELDNGLLFTQNTYTAYT